MRASRRSRLPGPEDAGPRGGAKDTTSPLRLHESKDATLRFLTDPQVPFTNNEAERDLRMMKLRQKISGGFRSRSGADDFAVLRTIIATAQKQGRDVVKALTGTSERFIADFQYA